MGPVVKAGTDERYRKGLHNFERQQLSNITRSFNIGT